MLESSYMLISFCFKNENQLIVLLLWQKVTEEKYDIKVVFEEAAMKISTATDPKVVVTITLTSPVMREGDDAEPGSCFMSFYSTTGPLISPFLDATLLTYIILSWNQILLLKYKCYD